MGPSSVSVPVRAAPLVDEMCAAFRNDVLIYRRDYGSFMLLSRMFVFMTVVLLPTHESSKMISRPVSRGSQLCHGSARVSLRGGSSNGLLDLHPRDGPELRTTLEATRSSAVRASLR